MKVSQKWILPSVSFIIRPNILGNQKYVPAENAENRRDGHHQMEMTDHEISGVEQDLDRGLRQEESAHAAADEQRDEAQGKQRSGVNAQLRAVQAAEPDQGR